MRLSRAGLLTLVLPGVIAKTLSEVSNDRDARLTQLPASSGTLSTNGILIELQKRAFAIAGGVAAAAGLATVGPEHPIILARLWLRRKTTLYGVAIEWERVDIISWYQHLCAYVFVGGLGAGAGHLAGMAANAFGPGATTVSDRAGDRNKLVVSPAYIDQEGNNVIHEGFREIWDQQNDEL